MIHNPEQYREIFRSTTRGLEKLKGTPLSAIGKELERVVSPFLADDGLSVWGPLQQLQDYIQRVLRMLPKSFGARFFFDAAMLQALAAELHPSIAPGRLLLPAYDLDWGYQSLVLPPDNRDVAFVINLFLFPGEDELSDVKLLEYPWIVHEFAHFFLFINETRFIEAFSDELADYLNTLKIASVADRGTAKNIAATHLKQLQERWTPTRNQRNWAHEIAMDTLAAWACGTAYIATFVRMLLRQEPNPLQFDTQHPPYLVRVAALGHVCKRLGLETKDLSHLHETYLREARSGDRSQLAKLAPQELVIGCTEAALGTARGAGLRRANPRRVVGGREECEFGFQLLHDAWQRYKNDSTQYHKWEQDIVASLCEAITQ